MDRLQKTTYIPTFDHVYGLMYEDLKGIRTTTDKFRERYNFVWFRCKMLLKGYISWDLNFETLLGNPHIVKETTKDIYFYVSDYNVDDIEIAYLKLACFMAHVYFLYSKQYETLVTKRICHRLSRWVNDVFFDDFIQDLIEFPKINHINSKTRTGISIDIIKNET
jgi:hypothetical protein